MAKKILSILCALAMMVTMVSVAAFSASAAPEGYADFDGLADMTVTTDTAWYGQTWWPSVASGRYTSTYFGSDVLFTTQARIVAESAENYNIDDEFSVKYYINRAKAGNGTSGTQYGYMNEFKLGDLYILFTSTNRIIIDCSIKYGDTVIATSEGSWTNYTAITVGSEEHEAIRTDFSTAYPSGANSWGADEERSKLEVNISFNDGKLTVAYGGIDTPNRQVNVEADIENADFSNAKMEVSVGERKNDGVALYGFTGTYKTVTTGGGEGGETPDPEIPDPEVPTTGTFVGLENATVAHESLADWSKSGEFNSAVFGETILVAGKKATATFADSYNIGDEFEFTYKMSSIYNNVAGDGVVINLGKLAISVAGTRSGPYYQVSIAYNGETVATSAESEYPWTAGKYTEDQVADDATYGSTFLDEIHSNVNTGLYKDINSIGGQSFFVHTVTCTYKDGKVSVTLFSGPTTTVEAQIDNADFTNAAMSIEVQCSANWYHKAIHNLAGTYTPAAEETPAPLAPTGVYPTLNSDLTLNVIYANAADYKDTVEVTATVDGDSQTVSLTEKGGNLVASFDFLTPDKFGSEITLNAVDTNGIAESYSTTYSVKQYCKNMMDNAGSSDDLKALCMALLQFGDSVAVYNGESSFLGDMSTYVTAYAPTAWTAGTAAWTYTGTANGAEWVGANLNFADEIGINVYFDADGDASDYTVDASFGTESDVIVDGDYFMATIRISSSFLSNQNEVAVKSAEGVISEVFTLSVEDWVNANIGKMDDAKKACAIALMTYGDAAAAYGN